jgi:hypothetical protein
MNLVSAARRLRIRSINMRVAQAKSSPSWVTAQGRVPPSFGLAQLSSLRASPWPSTYTNPPIG